nr:ribonuclease H-like domain-containing protein [Tanacetum cinerariifolium]
MSWFSTCSWCGGPFNGGNCRHCTNVSFENEPVYDSNPHSYNQTPNFYNAPPRHNYETDSRSNTGAAFQAEFAKFQQNFERLMAQSVVVVAAVKLPILNPNEFDLWKMRIEQYLLMTDYSLWEVILNGDLPLPTRIVDGVVQIVPPTTAEQRLAKKNEL